MIKAHRGRPETANEKKNFTISRVGKSRVEFNVCEGRKTDRLPKDGK